MHSHFQPFRALVVTFFALLVVLIPESAEAWGAGVHLQVASYILENVSTLPVWMCAIISRYPDDFYYGCVAADITLGKKHTHYLNHCHNWGVGLKILGAAKNDSEKSCAYGYLVHLAADTVAHSYYVPYKIVRTYNTALLKHTYWEMRFEALVPVETWDIAKRLSKIDFRANDALLRRVLANTLFSFSTNKRLFNSILFVSRLKHWQRVIDSMNARSKWQISEDDMFEYLTMAKQVAYSILLMEDSSIWNADPKGEIAINTAHMIRKNLKLLWKEGKLPQERADEIILEMKGAFRQGITQPDRLLNLLTYV